MPTTFLLRFQERKVLLPARIPVPRELLSNPAPDAKKQPRGAGQRGSIIEALNRIKEQLRDPAFVEAHQRYVWQETAYPLGQLVFAGIDLPWSDYARQAQELQSRCHADDTPQQTISEGLSAMPEPVYCAAARLYHALLDALSDYPAMRQLLDPYCTEAASDVYAAELQRLNAALREAQSEYGNTPREVQLRAEINKAFVLETASEWFEEYLRSWPRPGERMRKSGDAQDSPLCAAANHFLGLLGGQLQALADWQPGLAALTAYTLGAADTAPEKPADRRYWDAQLTDAPGVRQAEALNGQLGMRMLGRLSLPEGKANARKRPDVSGQMFFSAASLAALTAAELQQMCVQQLTVRRCGRCGKWFVPFSTSAKYCSRLAPNEGKYSCKKAASLEAAEANRREHPAVAVYTAVNNRLNTQLSRREGFPKERRKRVMVLWRAGVKPLVDAAVEQEQQVQNFDADAFDLQLADCFPAALAQEAKEWTQAAQQKSGQSL